MIIYKDAFSGNEIGSDIYDLERVGNVLLKVKAKYVTTSLDAAGIDIGANASAEDAAEGTEEATISGTNVALVHRLMTVGYTKKDYQKHIKPYMSKLIEHVKKRDGKEDNQLDDFKEDLKKAVKGILTEFSEYKFYLGETYHEDAMVILEKWEGETPYIIYFKDGLIEEKV